MQIVVLNYDYSYINMVSIQKAFRLIEKGKVVVEEWSDRSINTINKVFTIPSILRLKRFIDNLYKRKLLYSNKNVFLRDNYTCQYCGKENLHGRDLTIDHVKPRSKGGKSTFENVVTSCQACNSYKDNRLLNECKMMFYKKGWMPHTPTYLEIITKQQRRMKGM